MDMRRRSGRLSQSLVFSLSMPLGLCVELLVVLGGKSPASIVVVGTDLIASRGILACLLVEINFSPYLSFGQFLLLP